MRLGSHRVPTVLLAGAILLASAPAAEARRKSARQYRFDGFGVGDNFGKLFKRAPYSTPCDDDPVDKRRRRAMVYGGLPCRGKVFPQKTTVVLLLKNGRPTGKAHRYALPIVALAYIHGRYFKKRSNFPIHPGDPFSKARRRLGRVLATQRLSIRRRPAMTAHRFAGDIHILTEGTLVRGVVVGKMPRDTKNEQWRVITQMVRRYTPLSGQIPPRPRRLSKICAGLWKRAATCYKKSRLARKIIGVPSVFVRKCQRKSRDPDDLKIIRCMTRSGTCKAFEACARRP
jgi:hypothetical protein